MKGLRVHLFLRSIEITFVISHRSPESQVVVLFFVMCTKSGGSIETRLTFFHLKYVFMKTAFYTVVSQGDVSYVASQKAENGQLAMCIVRLREFGGGKYDNEYVCTMFGNLTQRKFHKNDLVVASLRFQVHEVGEKCYQEVIVNDIVKINNM